MIRGQVPSLKPGDESSRGRIGCLGNPAGLDEGIQGRPLQPDVPAELDVADAALGDKAADESLAGPQIVAGLAWGQQLVGSAIEGTDRFDYDISTHVMTVPEQSPVLLLLVLMLGFRSS
jgi:hypothetical protein